MLLSELLKYDNIVIQCHNNPDADALASGMALSYYLELNDKNYKFIYGGKFKVQKSNLVLMMEELGIEAKYLESKSDADYATNIETFIFLLTQSLIIPI